MEWSCLGEGAGVRFLITDSGLTVLLTYAAIELLFVAELVEDGLYDAPCHVLEFSGLSPRHPCLDGLLSPGVDSTRGFTANGDQPFGGGLSDVPVQCSSSFFVLIVCLVARRLSSLRAWEGELVIGGLVRGRGRGAATFVRALPLRWLLELY